MESVKPQNINWKIAFSPKQNIIILFDSLFFYTQSLASLISKGEQIINFREQEYYSTTKSEIIESRISFTDRKINNLEKLDKQRKRSIIWFKIFLFFTAFFFYFNWQDYLYLSYITLLACFVSSIFSIPLVRLHGFFEKDILDRLTKYRMYLSSEKEKISKIKKKEDDALKTPIPTDAKTLGALYNILVQNKITKNITAKTFENYAIDSFISSKTGKKFSERTLINFFSDKEEDVMSLYNDFLEEIQKINDIAPIREAVPNHNANRLFYHLKNTFFELKIPDEQLEVLLKIYSHRTLTGNKETINLDKFEKSHLRNLLKSHF